MIKEKLKNVYEKFVLKNFDNVTRTDYIIFTILMLICFFSFQHGDIILTALASRGYLYGHILDFYDFNLTNKGVVLPLRYFPSSYILFAIWNAPLAIFGLFIDPETVRTLFAFANTTDPTIASELTTKYWWLKLFLFYNKLFLSILYFLSAFVLYKIALDIGILKNRAKLIAFIFISSPIAFFSQFIFGQYDIFTVIFILLGMLFYYRDHMIKFVIFFGIAMTFKYFALLFFLPLLFLKEKRISKLIIYAIIFAIPTLLEILLYINSPAFHSGVFGFTAINYFSILSLPFNWYSLKPTSFILIVICAWAYFIVTDTKEELVKWSLFLLSGIVFISFGLSMWHPQWLLMAVPILVLGTMINKKAEIFLLIDLILMYTYVVMTLNIFPNNVDMQLFLFGILNPGFDTVISSLQMQASSIYPKDFTLIPTIFAAALFVNFMFKHPKYSIDKMSDTPVVTRFVVLLRFVLGISFFILPAFNTLIKYLMRS